MNKDQKILAENVIQFLKDCDGMTTYQNILNKYVELNNNRFSVLAGLKDRELIANVGDSSYRLTEKGWDFISFNNIKREEYLKKVKDNITFIINILLMAATIYLSIINSDLSKQNDVLTRQTIESKAKLLQLEKTLDYHLDGHEKIHESNKK